MFCGLLAGKRWDSKEHYYDANEGDNNNDDLE
jgi:hypothetical protein